MSTRVNLNDGHKLLMFDLTVQYHLMEFFFKTGERVNTFNSLSVLLLSGFFITNIVYLIFVECMLWHFLRSQGG